MSDMDEKYLDDLARIAAQKNNPAFSEEAWNKMNVLLENEFDTKKKRRFVFWWILPVGMILGLGVYYTAININRNSATQDTRAIFGNEINQPQAIADPNNTIKHLEKNDSIRNNAFTVQPTPKKIIEKKASLQVASSNQNESIPQKNNGIDQHENKSKAINNEASFIAENKLDLSQNSSNETKAETLNTHEVEAQNTAANTIIQKGNEQIKIQENNNGTTFTENKNRQKTNDKELSRWSLITSAAIDGSFVHISNIEKAAIVAGIGMNYRINKKFSLSTGFYAGHKIYEASKDDYEFKSNPSYYNYIQFINANCLVYEIPVSVRYNFAAAKKSNWYATVGLSSLIMKQENYDAFIQANWGSAWYSYSYSNENAHLFSTATLSLGYEIRMDKAFFLSFEPYYKLPLKGVGEGSVQLSSIGMQTSLRYNFLRKNKPLVHPTN